MLVHHPHLASNEGWQHLEGDTSFLGVHKTVTSLTTTKTKRRGREMLVIGTPLDLVVHDLTRNADLFYREVGFFSLRTLWTF